MTPTQLAPEMALVHSCKATPAARTTLPQVPGVRLAHRRFPYHMSYCLSYTFVIRTRCTAARSTNWYGQLGLGDMATRGDQPGDMGSGLAPVDLGTEGGGAAGGGAALRVAWLAAGDQHTCAVLQPGGRAKCWGEWGACGGWREREVWGGGAMAISFRGVGAPHERCKGEAM